MEDEPMTETNDTVKKCLAAVRKSVFPQHTLLLQKCYMRWSLQKPHDLKTREWLAHIYEINNYLPHFPGENPTKLDDSKMKKIAKYGIPYN